jgi:hypothetical protein
MIIRLFVAFIVIVAVIVGVMAISLPREEILRLVMFRDFFDVSLPILGFGALVKYLCSCTCRKCACGCGNQKECCNK